MNIDLRTVAFEVINFLILLWLLRRYLFQPVKDLVLRRREEIERRTTEVEADRAAAEAMRADYAARLAVLEQEAESRRQAARREAHEQGEAIVDRARADADKLKQELSRDLEDMRRRVLEQVRTRVAVLARDAASVILREAGGDGLDVAFAQRGAHRLLSETRGLRADAPVRVELCSDADEDAVKEALRSVLGPTRTLEVGIDDDLVAGVRLTVGDVEVEASAAATLEAWTDPDGTHAVAATGRA